MFVSKMSASQLAGLVIVLYSFTTSVSVRARVSDETIESRFASLEKQLKLQDNEIKHQQRRIQQLEKKQLYLETEVEEQRVFIKTILESEISERNVTVSKFDTFKSGENINKKKSSILYNGENLSLKKHSTRSKLALRGVQEVERVAFTVYATKVIEHLGQGQPIKFDTILTNLGNSYNILTGVFTVPVDGLYGFTFYIAEYNVHQLYASLVVDGQRTVQAIADGMHNGHDVQGGNFAVLNLNVGQSVWLECDVVDGYIWASNGNRFESFSGFLLY